MKDLAWTPARSTRSSPLMASIRRKVADIARNKKATYLDTYGRSAPGWHFPSDYHGTLSCLPRRNGFTTATIRRFSSSCTLGDYGADAGRQDGWYLYGIRARQWDLRFGVDRAAEGRSTAAIDKILLWCYHYDPIANAYVLFGANPWKAGGVLTVLILICVVALVPLESVRGPQQLAASRIVAHRERTV